MSAFSKITGAKASRTGNWAKFGIYLFEVLSLQFFKGNSGDTFVAEFKVLEAKKSCTEEPSAVGSTVSYVEICDGKWADSASGRAKAFLEDLTGGEVDDDGLELLVGKKQQGRFLKIKGEAFPKAKKGKSGSKDPQDYVTAWRWENIVPTDAELDEIMKRRAATPVAA